MQKTPQTPFAFDSRPKGFGGRWPSTFKSLVWVSNLGGLLLFAIGLESDCPAVILYRTGLHCSRRGDSPVPIQL